MKKFHKYWLSPNKESFCMSLTINGKCVGSACRLLVQPYSVWDSISVDDVTTHDLELHAFLRISHQYIVDKDALEVKIEEMFDLENLNLV